MSLENIFSSRENKKPKKPLSVNKKYNSCSILISFIVNAVVQQLETREKKRAERAEAFVAPSEQAKPTAEEKIRKKRKGDDEGERKEKKKKKKHKAVVDGDDVEALAGERKGWKQCEELYVARQATGRPNICQYIEKVPECVGKNAKLQGGLNGIKP